MKATKGMTKAMVIEYNRLTGKNIKKFSSRAAGERQLAAARGEAAPTAATKLKKVKKEKTVKVKKTADAVHADRSESARESWGNHRVAKDRSQKHGVKVDGCGEYKSVKAAFVDLKLPLGKHILFRGQVKKNGKAVFEHNDKAFTFRLVEKAA